jgi:hypothetical protein
MFDKKFSAMIGLILILLVLLACGVFTTPQPTQTPEPPTPTSTSTPIPPAIYGKLDPWTEDTPIVGRYLALCKISKTEGKMNCDLMTTFVITDEQGEFEFFDVPTATYMVIHDSGIGSFEKAMEKWGGTAIRVADPAWCDKYFGEYDAGSGWISLRIPKGANIDPNAMKAYGQFSLGLGNSPFILAHLPGAVFNDEPLLIRHITVEVIKGEIARLTLPITYYGE